MSLAEIVHKVTHCMSDSIDLNLLFSTSKFNPNIILLKKIVALTWLGIVKINGQLPNEAYDLQDYLFSNGTFTVDFSALDSPTRTKFEKWLFDPHMNDCTESYFHDVFANDFRGYTSEIKLNWWGRILNFFFYRKASMNWTITPLEISSKNQFRKLFCNFGENGFLLGFDFLNLRNLLDFKKDSDIENINDQPNSKRIKLTSQIVDALLHLNLDEFDAKKVLKQKHPLSISVSEKMKGERQMLMNEYRFTYLYEDRNPWYKRLWQWFLSLFNSKKIEKSTISPIIYKRSFSVPILSSSEEKSYKMAIKYDPNSGAVQVIEECKDIDSVVYCGGGGKISAHLGALSAAEDHNIHFKHFAGSSAGAIMALLGYLGYTSKESNEFIQMVNKDLLIHYDIDWNGLSDPRALKAALDFAINRKVLSIIKTYQRKISSLEPEFIEKKVLINGIISFKSLKNLKAAFPDCGIGASLKVTATNQTKNKSVIFDYKNTPFMEVSEAVKVSASMPPLFKPTSINNEMHTDGGTSRNLPVDCFPDLYNQLIGSSFGIHIGTLGFCFDFGVEKIFINNFRNPIYIESALLNLLYSFLTGVKNPAQGWRQDRVAMLRNSSQVVILPADIPSTEFTVPPAKQQELMLAGYAATAEHLAPIYNQETKRVEQHMYAIYSSVEELMVHCAIRGKKELFISLKPFAETHGVSVERLRELENFYTFLSPKLPNKNSPLTDAADNTHIKTKENSINKRILPLNTNYIIKYMRIFDAIYPLFLIIKPRFFLTQSEYNVFKKARHFFNPLTYDSTLQILSSLTGLQHLIISVLIFALTEAESDSDKICDQFDLISLHLRENEHLITSAEWFFDWKLNKAQLKEVLQFIIQNKFEECTSWMRKHQRKITVLPFQNIESTFVEEKSNRQQISILK